MVRWCFSAGRISPPAPPQRIHVNNNHSNSVSLNSTAGPSSSSNEPTSSSDEDRIRPRVVEKSDSISSRTSNRPTVAPKPKFDTKLDENRLNSIVDKVTWRVDKPESETLRVENSLKGSFRNESTDQPHGLRKVSPELDTNAVLVNTHLTNDEAGSSSPSSSGIVADINDSNGESNQRTSATSSLSSCEPATDLNEPGYDTPRPGRTYRPLSDSNSTTHHFPSTNIHITQSPTPQRAQLGHISREPSRLLMPTLEEKVEPGSTSVLENMLAGLAEPTTVHSGDNTFNRSVSMDNQKTSSYGRQITRTPSTTSESLYGTAHFNGDDNFRRRSSTLSEPNPRSESAVNGVSNQEAGSQKRIVCDKLTENFRAIDIAVKRIGECTAARAWRQPHILQRHLDDIQENVETIVKALKDFLDAGCRIAVDANNPKAEDLKRLLSTLQNSSATMTMLKQNLDSTGWTLAALSRQRNIYGTTQSSDSLDQFLAITKQLPTDCYKLVQWALTLVPAAGVRFLATGLKDTTSTDNMSASIYQPENGAVLRTLSSEAENAKRQSSISVASSMTISSLNDLQMPTSLQATKSIINPDSSTSSDKSNRVTFTDKVNSTQRLSSLIAEGHVLEEDDLESVVSDRDSFYQDYTMANDDSGLIRRKRPTTSLPPAPQLSAEAMNALSEDDRQLISFYSPQLDAHTKILSKEIDEFLVVVEEQLPPHEFVQKGKLIILAAHKLIYIGDNIAQCITAGEVSSEVRRTADRLCNVLKTCVQATKQAADEYPTVSAIQSMVDSIVTVSHAAQDLKLLVNSAAV